MPEGPNCPSYTIDQVASLLRVSRRTVYNMIADGRLETIRTGGQTSQRVTRLSLDQLRSLGEVTLRRRGQLTITDDAIARRSPR